MSSEIEKARNISALITWGNVIAILGYIACGLLLICAIVMADAYINSSAYVIVLIAWAISNAIFGTIVSLVLKNRAYMLEALINIQSNTN